VTATGVGKPAHTKNVRKEPAQNAAINISRKFLTKNTYFHDSHKGER
jgi:hypothetical protein